MRKGFYSILIVFALMSCGETPQQVPFKDFIAQPQMTEILTSICKVEARYQRRFSGLGKNNAELVLENYKLVFDEHQVSLTQFKNSYAYYAENPTMMQEIYDSVIVKLSLEQSVLQKKADKEVDDIQKSLNNK